MDMFPNSNAEVYHIDDWEKLNMIGISLRNLQTACSSEQES